MSFFFVKFIAMKIKYTITKRGEGKAVSLSDGSIALDDKTTQKNLKKIHDLGFTHLVIKEDAKEDSSASENATD